MSVFYRCMFNLGFTEIIALGTIALLFIGPKQLPEIARTLARLLNEFKHATGDLKKSFTDVKRETHNVVRSMQNEIDQATHSARQADQEIIRSGQVPIQNKSDDQLSFSGMESVKHDPIDYDQHARELAQYEHENQNATESAAVDTVGAKVPSVQDQGPLHVVPRGTPPPPRIGSKLSESNPSKSADSLENKSGVQTSEEAKKSLD